MANKNQAMPMGVIIGGGLGERIPGASFKQRPKPTSEFCGFLKEIAAQNDVEIDENMVFDNQHITLLQRTAIGLMANQGIEARNLYLLVVSEKQKEVMKPLMNELMVPDINIIVCPDSASFPHAHWLAAKHLDKLKKGDCPTVFTPADGYYNNLGGYAATQKKAIDMVFKGATAVDIVMSTSRSDLLMKSGVVLHDEEEIVDFVEKPNAEKLQKMYQTGHEMSVSIGVFVATPKSILKAHKEAFKSSNTGAFKMALQPGLQCAELTNTGWDDLGTFESMYQSCDPALKTKNHKNAYIFGHERTQNDTRRPSINCLLLNYREEVKLAIKGLDGLMVLVNTMPDGRTLLEIADRKTSDSAKATYRALFADTAYNHSFFTHPKKDGTENKVNFTGINEEDILCVFIDVEGISAEIIATNGNEMTIFVHKTGSGITTMED